MRTVDSLLYLTSPFICDLLRVRVGVGVRVSHEDVIRRPSGLFETTVLAGLGFVWAYDRLGYTVLGGYH